MKRKKHKIRLIGRREFVSLSQLGLFKIEAKIDTGAYTSSLHCENLSVNYENSKPILYFTLEQGDINSPAPRNFRFEEFTQKKIKNSFGEMEERYVIKTLVHICKKQIWSEISLSNRDTMRYQVLIGRKLLKGKFLIDVSQIHTNGERLNKGFIRLTQKNNS
ncbi:MAG TPA: RimK/LysX family protein [Bacteroidia bacterium]|nr:RimK/LysX family protein [Bacteroidia bacterium]